MCKVVKGFHGWQAETIIDVGNSHVLCFFTMKRYGGDLVTTATRKRKVGNGSFSHSPMDDFSESIIRERVRVTSSAVRHQHTEALQQKNDIIARMKEFYDSKRDEQQEAFKPAQAQEAFKPAQAEEVRRIADELRDRVSIEVQSQNNCVVIIDQDQELEEVVLTGEDATAFLAQFHAHLPYQPADIREVDLLLYIAKPYWDNPSKLLTKPSYQMAR